MKPNIKYFLLIISLLQVMYGFAPAIQPTPQPRDGVFTTRYANGNVQQKGKYRQSEKHGLWYEYSEKGVLISKEKWKQGIRLWKLEYEKGILIRITDKEGKVTDRPKCGC